MSFIIVVVVAVFPKDISIYKTTEKILNYQTFVTFRLQWTWDPDSFDLYELIPFFEDIPEKYVITISELIKINI